MRVLVLGLTGFGNAALRGLRTAGMELLGVLTRREPGTFPYYPERNLAEEAREYGLAVHDDVRLAAVTPAELCGGIRPDLMMVASFDQRIPPAWIGWPQVSAVNLHPSLLPAYRGATPTAWCLIRGERETGVTVHHLTDEVDAGPIILQRRLPIAWDDTDGRLRQKLAREAELLVRDLIGLLQRGERLPAIPQNEAHQSRFPKRSARDAWVHFDHGTTEVYNRIRANLPYPGPLGLLGTRRIPIRAAVPLPPPPGEAAPGTVLRETGDVLDIRTRDGAIRVWVSGLSPLEEGGDASLGQRNPEQAGRT